MEVDLDPRINWEAVDGLLSSAEGKVKGYLAESAIRWAVSGFIENNIPHDMQAEWLDALSNQIST